VNWKILDGGKSNAASAQARAQADALRAQLTDLESRIAFDVTARRLDLDSPIAGRQAVAQRGIEAARDALRVARDRFREGVLTSSELLDAETRLLRAELEATQTEGQIQVATAQLQSGDRTLTLTAFASGPRRRRPRTPPSSRSSTS
jgi:outer membrane protein